MFCVINDPLSVRASSGDTGSKLEALLRDLNFYYDKFFTHKWHLWNISLAPPHRDKIFHWHFIKKSLCSWNATKGEIYRLLNIRRCARTSIKRWNLSQQVKIWSFVNGCWISTGKNCTAFAAHRLQHHSARESETRLRVERKKVNNTLGHLCLTPRHSVPLFCLFYAFEL